MNLQELRAAADRGDDRHGAARAHRHAGAPAGQAPDRAPLPRRGRRARRRGLQLPARRRRGDGARSSGYELFSWERGYGDFVLRPDLDTLRPVPWQEGTVVCLADVAWEDGSDVSVSPRQVLRGQLARLAERGWMANAGHRARVHRLSRHLRAGLAQGLSRARAGEPLQRRLLAARHRARGAADAPYPQQHGGGGHALRGLQGRVQLRPARGQLPLRRRAEDGRRARDLQERRQGDRGAGGHVGHVHGQVRRARGQLVPHPLLARRRARVRCSRASRPCSSPSSPGSSRRCAS